MIMKNIKFLFSPVFMGILFVLFAGSMAVATFLENDFGAAAAYSMVYDAWWFELILLLLAVNLVGRLITLKMYRKDKLTVFLFHFSFLLMILGAGITRYFGWEGSIHIREGEAQNTCYSIDKYIWYSVKDAGGKLIDSQSDKYTLTSVSADTYKKKLDINNKEYDLVLSKIIPNATEDITDSPDGEPMVSLLVTKGMMVRENLVLKKGDRKSTDGITIGFSPAEPADINISYDAGTFLISSKYNLAATDMGSQTIESVEAGKPLELSKCRL